MQDWIWQPYFPPPLAALAAGLAAAAAVWSALRGAAGEWLRPLTLLLMRLGVIGAVFLFLMGPSRLPETAPSEAEAVPLQILVDRSGSMLTRDMDGDTRWAFALERWLDPDLLARLGAAGPVRVRTFDAEPADAGLAELSPDPVEAEFGTETRVVRSLERALDDQPPGQPGRILLLSDGHDSLDDSPAGLLVRARDSGTRIFTVPLGGPRLERDLHVVGLPLQPFLVAGESGTLRVRVLQTNARDMATTLRVTTEEGTTTHPVRFGKDPFVHVDLPLLHKQPGTYAYTLGLDPLPGEIEKRNNHQTLFIEVTPERFRVLMLEGEPYWDTKFIAQTLRRDPRLELMQVSQIAPGRRETLVTRIPEEQAGFPETARDLAAFDVVILGRNIENVAGAAWLELLPEFVTRRGGRIIFARGRAFDVEAVPDAGLREQLRMLEPVEVGDRWLSDVRFEPGAAGRRHPALRISEDPAAVADLFRELPPVARARVSVPGAGSQVLADFTAGGERTPALVAQEIGSGQTLMWLGDGLWRWRMPGPSRANLGGVYESLWSNTVRWMLAASDFKPGAEVSLDLRPRQLRLGQPVTATIATRFPDADRFPRELNLQLPDGTLRTLSVEPDGTGMRAELRWTPEETGVHRVVLPTPGLEPGQLDLRFNVYDVNVERLQSAARPDLLRLIARESGGAFLDPYEPGALPGLLERQAAAREIPVRPEYVWNQGLWLFLLASTAGLEWILRKRWGWI